LLNSKIQDFINRQLHSTAADLMLQASKYPEWDMKAIAQQLVGKQIAKKKLPSWFKNETILYPVRLSMEQCSSEETASYKSTIISAGKGIDLTGGFGVDTYFLAQNANSVIYCERNADLAEIVSSNFKAFNQSNCEIHTGDGITYLQQLEKLDWIFVDPARRKESERVCRLEDCEPNVIALKSLFFEKADRILIKTAPLLDIQQTLSDLDSVKEVHVISVNNDCKEVLYLLEKGYSNETQVFCINLKKETQEKFSFTFSEERNAVNQYSEPLEYLYEPNASIMKSGAFKSIASKYGLYKLHQHSHLYTSKELVSAFPGRSFKIKALIHPDKKSLAKHIKGKANLACRNYQQKVDALKKKLKLKDGGDDYLFATTLMDDKSKLILCEKL
jgi:16S rRNA G966 N2-methylase RsmD